MFLFEFFLKRYLPVLQKYLSTLFLSDPKSYSLLINKYYNLGHSYCFKSTASSSLARLIFLLSVSQGAMCVLVGMGVIHTNVIKYDVKYNGRPHSYPESNYNALVEIVQILMY